MRVILGIRKIKTLHIQNAFQIHEMLYKEQSLCETSALETQISLQFRIRDIWFQTADVWSIQVLDNQF